MEWVNDRINHALISEEERRNFEAFRKVLLNNRDVVEHHGGRYLLIRNGEVWKETFESPQDTFSGEFDAHWVLFRIPKDGLCDNPSIFCSVERHGEFDEVRVPVKSSIKTPSRGFSGAADIDSPNPSDSGASDTTSCPRSNVLKVGFQSLENGICQLFGVRPSWWRTIGRA